LRAATSALRIAVSLRLNFSSAMGSPPKYKSPRQGIMVPWRLRYQNLPVALSHGSLQKVRVGLLVDSETGLGETGCQDSSFPAGCPYIVCA